MSDIRPNEGDCLARSLTSAVFADNTSQRPASQTMTDIEVQALPSEIIVLILEDLRIDSEFETLANVAQVSIAMYDLVISKLYQRIQFTKSNEQGLLYGCTESKGAGDHGQSSQASRKDIALSRTQELVLETIPSIDIAKKLPNVKEVEVVGSCFDDGEDPHPHSDTQRFLSTLAKAHPAEPLHVRCHVTLDREYSDICQFADFDTPSLDYITYEFFDLPVLAPQIFRPLWVAFCLRSTIHFSDRSLGTYQTEAHIVDNISFQLLDAFRRRTPSYPRETGRLYLCNIPELVLTPKELVAAVDIKEDALRKLHDNYNSWMRNMDVSLRPSPSWEAFKAMVKLVEPGFRPSEADLKEGRTLIPPSTATD